MVSSRSSHGFPELRVVDKMLQSFSKSIDVFFLNEEAAFSIDNEFQPAEMSEAQMLQLDEIRKSYFNDAELLVKELMQEPEADFQIHNQEIEEIKFFYNFS